MESTSLHNNCNTRSIEWDEIYLEKWKEMIKITPVKFSYASRLKTIEIIRSIKRHQKPELHMVCKFCNIDLVRTVIDKFKYCFFDISHALGISQLYNTKEVVDIIKTLLSEGDIKSDEYSSDDDDIPDMVRCRHDILQLSIHHEQKSIHDIDHSEILQYICNVTPLSDLTMLLEDYCKLNNLEYTLKPITQKEMDECSDIQLIMDQTQCTKEVAIKVYQRFNNDIILSITEILDTYGGPVKHTKEKRTNNIRHVMLNKKGENNNKKRKTI